MPSGNRDQRVRMPRVPEIASFVSAVPWAAAGMSSRMVAIPAAKPSSLLRGLFGDYLAGTKSHGQAFRSMHAGMT